MLGGRVTFQKVHVVRRDYICLTMHLKRNMWDKGRHVFNRQNKRDAECFCKKMQTHEPLTCLCTHNLYDSSCTMLLIIMYPLSLSPLKTKRPNNPTSSIHPFPPVSPPKPHLAHTKIDRGTLRQGLHHLPCLITFQQGSPHIVAPTTSAFQKFMVFPLRLWAANFWVEEGDGPIHLQRKNTSKQKNIHSSFLFF